MGETCTHKGLTKVLNIGDSEVWAGSEFQVSKGEKDFEMVISLTGHPNRKPVKFRMSRGSLRVMATLNAYMKRRQHNLIIDWPDMQAPELDLEFWQALHADLSVLEGRVVIHCMGGHGRTGTALAILAFLSKAHGEEDVVTWVRRVYCHEAVETTSQLLYLRNVIGIPTTQGPSSAYKWGSKEAKEATGGGSKYFRGKDKGTSFPLPEDLDDDGIYLDEK